MSEPLITKGDCERAGALAIAFFYCPLCGDRERLGELCGCKLRWTEDRRGMFHYAVLLSLDDAEKLRHKLSRRLTHKLIERHDLYTDRQGPCIRTVVDRPR